MASQEDSFEEFSGIDSAGESEDEPESSWEDKLQEWLEGDSSESRFEPAQKKVP